MQLLALTLVGLVVFIAWRALKKEMKRVGDELERQETRRAKHTIPVLQKDKDGVYRPKNDS
jgi:Mg2+/citrate symporter